MTGTKPNLVFLVFDRVNNRICFTSRKPTDVNLDLEKMVWKSDGQTYHIGEAKNPGEIRRETSFLNREMPSNIIIGVYDRDNNEHLDNTYIFYDRLYGDDGK